jgi:hypothetical protein
MLRAIACCLFATLITVAAAAQKNVNAKDWVILPSFDGRLYSAYPGGNKPPIGSFTSTLLLYTDIVAGPTTGGEGNNGAYLSIYGLNLASKFSDLGSTTRVYVCGTEVANYRVLTGAVNSGTTGPGNGVYNTFGIERLTVQVGALGTPTAGVACAIDIKTSGVSTPVNATNGSGQYLDLDGNAITFTPQPGPMIYVDPVNGNDSNSGSFSAPLQHLQYWTGTGDITGAVYFPSSPSGATQSNVIQPGTHIILRGGTYTYNINGSGSLGARWMVLWLATGTAPNGASASNTVAVNGVNTNAAGPIVVTSYPGAAGANSPELASWVGASGSAGGVDGTDTTRSTATTPWGFSGFGQYLTISNLRITSYPASPADGAPINKQSGANYWRIVNNELVWKMTGSPAQAGGIAGWGHNSYHYGNYIHDIYGDSALENHGIYTGSGSSDTETNSIYAYNVINNVTNGNCHQVQNGSSTAESGISIHHEWYQGCGKYVVNVNQTGGAGISANIWDNVFVDGLAGVRINSDNSSGFNIIANTIVGWTTYAGLTLSSGSGAGTILFQDNIVYQRSGNGSDQGFVVNNGNVPLTLDTNLWYNANTPTTPKPAADAGGIGGSGANPLFNDLAGLDLTLQSGSPALNAGVTPTAVTVSRDFLFLSRPQGTRNSIGAYEKAGGL